jgi:hypothetical protein
VGLAITACQKGSLLAPIFSNIAEEGFSGVAYSALADPHSPAQRPRMFSCAGCTVGKYLELDETTTDGGVDKVATTTMTKEYFEDLGRIAETNAKSARESARIATEYWVSSRERNDKVAQDITRTITESMKHQTEANEQLRSRIFEILEERDEAHKRFFEQWAEAFTSVPFEYTRQAAREAQKKTASLK